MNPSLQRDLRRWSMIVTIIGGSLTATFSFVFAYIHAKDFQDDLLEQVSTWLLAESSIQGAQFRRGFDDEQIIIQPLSNNKPLPLSSTLSTGFHNIDSQFGAWRVLIIEVKKTKFAIAQQTELRHEIAIISALTAALPVILLAIIVFIGLHLMITRHLQPIDQLAQEVNRRETLHLTPLSTQNLPLEITPFIEAINHLLTRIDESIQKQQRFIADAAHELRTPVAGLTLLAENLQSSGFKKEQAEQLHIGLERLKALVEQLLNLARLQSDILPEGNPVDADKLLQQVIITLHPLAQKKNIDLGVIKIETIQVIDYDDGLWHIFQNAIDNAIKYTPHSGFINIYLYKESEMMVFKIEDSGIGIPQETLNHIFEPFHRGKDYTNQGSGLGLAISHQIAKQAQGSITIRNLEVGGVQFIYRQRLP